MAEIDTAPLAGGERALYWLGTSRPGGCFPHPASRPHLRPCRRATSIFARAYSIQFRRLDIGQAYRSQVLAV